MESDALIRLIKDGKVDDVKEFVEKTAKADLKAPAFDEFVAEAAYSNKADIVMLFIEKGANIEARSKYINGTPLSFAVTHNDLHLVKYLISKGADVNARVYGIKILTHATGRGNTEIVKVLLESGANPTTSDYRYEDPAFLKAAIEGFVDIVELLLDYKVKKYAAGNENALAAACRHNQKDVVKLLLTKGKFKFNQKKKKLDRGKYDSPLEEACQNGHIDCAQLLLDAGADPNFAFGDGRVPPMNYAIQGGHVKLVKLLHKYGAALEYDDRKDPNRDHFNMRQNPLGAACYYGNLAIVKYLIENGANPTVGASNDEDYTPLEHAKNECHKDIVEYLTKMTS